MRFRGTVGWRSSINRELSTTTVADVCDVRQDPAMGAAEHEASCSCGQLQARAVGDPVRVSMCHCLACQRRTGSTYGVQARFPREQVTIIGEASEYVRHADEDGAERRSFFCPQCGSTVYYVTDESSELVAIPVGAFADPEFPAPWVSVWEERRHKWVSVPPGAERIS